MKNTTEYLVHKNTEKNLSILEKEERTLPFKRQV